MPLIPIKNQINNIRKQILILVKINKNKKPNIKQNKYYIKFGYKKIKDNNTPDK